MPTKPQTLNLNSNKAFVLYSDALSLLENNRVLSAMVSRSGLEILCSMIEFYRKIKASLLRRDLIILTTLINFSFQT